MADALYEQRRYTALILRHHAIPDYQSLHQVLRNTRRSGTVSLPKSSTWHAVRFDYMAPRSLYPDKLTPSVEEGHGYPHAMYFAVREGLDVAEGPVVVLASPYVRLLGRLVRRLRSDLPGPAPRYLSVDMARVYEAAAEGQPGLTATRVTMQMLNEPTLELVSLAGRNPLHSELHAALRTVTAPYSIRAEVDGESGLSRVNADRHGNLWWYQADESRFQRPLRLIDALDHWGAIRWGRSLPLDRVGEDDSG